MTGRIGKFIVLAWAATAAAACGQKGPLFLPGDPSSIQTTVPPQTPAEDVEAADEDERDDEDAQEQ